MFRGVVLVLLLLASTAWADDVLSPARNAISQSDYAAAHDALKAALEAGQCSPAEIAELYLLSGQVEAALGNAEAATEAFRRLLALSPQAELPPGASPRYKRPFAAAAGSRSPFELKLQTTAQPPAVTLLLTDPLRLVDRARVHYAVDGGAERTQDVAASARAELALPIGARIDVRVVALDAQGNRLIELEAQVIRPDVPRAVPARSASPATVAAPRPLYLRWWPYAAATVVFGGATGYFGYTAYQDALDLKDAVAHGAPRVEADEIAARGRRNTLLLNIGFGVTGACAIVTGILFVTTPRGRAETRVAAVPLTGGGALVLGGRF
jgi:tetratricopeptide (TPR) repeat protein